MFRPDLLIVIFCLRNQNPKNRAERHSKHCNKIFFQKYVRNTFCLIMATYTIEKAKSGRAKCKACKEPIAKGDLRIQTSTNNGEYDLTHSTHLACFKVPRKLQCSAKDFVREHLMDSTEDQVLSTDFIEVVEAKIEMATSTPKKKKAKQQQGEDNTLMGRIKQAALDMAVEEEEPEIKVGPAKKKQKIEHGENDFDLLVAEYCKIASAKPKVTVATLKDYLRWNRQVLKGAKDFVLLKVLDGKVNGRLGHCELCGGKLKMDEEKEEMIICSGQFDEAANVRIPCAFSDHRLSPKVPRKPFFTVKPTEEEEQEMDQLKEQAANGPSLDGNPVAQEILAEAEKMDWKITGHEDVRSATEKVLKLVEGKVALPEENAMKVVGPMVLANMDKTPKELAQIVMDRFGFAEAKQAKAEETEAVAQSLCAFKKNAGVFLAFQELAQLYFKREFIFLNFFCFLSFEIVCLIND